MQYAIVTGATQGIGKAIAEKLLNEGFAIAVCSRSTERINSLQEEWMILFPDSLIKYYCADLANKNEVEYFGKMILIDFPQIDILVNNAGAFLPGNIADEPEGLLENLININLFSAYYLTRLLLPFIKVKKKGHIFNMCSIASLKAYPNGGAYSISKYALLGFSDNLRLELMPYNIKVTALCPGATFTPSWAEAGIEPNRIMEANDIANMLWAAYCLSEQANVEMLVMRPVKGDL